MNLVRLIFEAKHALDRVGAPGLRDRDNPCFEFSPGLSRGDCETDGHYLCLECQRRDQHAALMAPEIPSDGVYMALLQTDLSYTVIVEEGAIFFWDKAVPEWRGERVYPGQVRRFRSVQPTDERGQDNERKQSRMLRQMLASKSEISAWRRYSAALKGELRGFHDNNEKLGRFSFAMSMRALLVCNDNEARQ